VNGWIVGYLIGGVVVVVVVVVLLLMILGARRVAEKAEQIVAALHDARDGTAALREVHTTVDTADRIVAAAAAARGVLSGGGAR
jgi:Sec-independent protein translocase protein TatA